IEVASRLIQDAISIGVIDLIDLTGFDRAAFEQDVSTTRGIVTLEEGFRGRGGMDALFFDMYARSPRPKRVLNIGVEGGYQFNLGTRADLHEAAGIGVDAVMATVRRFAADIKVSTAVAKRSVQAWSSFL